MCIFINEGKNIPINYKLGKLVSPFLGCFNKHLWYFQVTRSCINALMSSNYCQIRQLIMELAVLERLVPTEKKWNIAIIAPILFKLARNEAMNNIFDKFEFRPDQTPDY